MTNVTRAELEACARLLGVVIEGHIECYDVLRYGMAVHSGNPMNWRDWNPLSNDADLLELARAAKLDIFYTDCCVQVGIRNDYGTVDWISFNWPDDGTEAECIIRAASAVQLEREKQ